MVAPKKKYNVSANLTSSPDYFSVSILNLIPTPILICDQDQKLTFVNSNFETLLDYTSKHLIGKSYIDVMSLISPASNINSDKISHIIVKEQININLRLELQHRKGNTIPVIMNVNPLVSSQDDTVGILVIFEDLREKIKSKEFQQFSDFIINSINTGVIAIDNNRKITSFNKAAEKITGLKCREALSKDYEEVFDKIPDSNKYLLQTLLSGNNINNYEFTPPNKNGQVLSMDTGPIKDDIGFIKGAVAILRDISEQRSLSQLQQQVQFIIDSINAGVTVINEEQCYVTLNKQAELITGLDREKSLGKKITEIYGKDFKLHSLETLLTGKEYKNHEIKLEANGVTKTLLINTTQLKNDKGLVIGAVNVFFDITDQKLMEEKIQRAEKLAALGEMAAGTAHEIRNPLTAVKGFLQLLDNKFIEQDTEKQYIQIMIDEIENVNQIVKEFLLFSKPQAPKFKETNINELLESLTKLVENEAFLNEICIVKEFFLDLPPVNIDPEQIKQVMVNIIQNAIQSMDSGGIITLTTRWELGQPFIEIVIKDSGTGIPKELLKKIFDPFFSTKEVGKGTGLGLTIAHQIIKQNKGQLDVSSIVGKGTEFIVKLPIEIRK